MLFCIICTDRPFAEEVRLANREAHLSYWRKGKGLQFGGPFTSDDGEHMSGSFLVVEAEDRAAVTALAAEDPYAKAGLFQSVDIRAWKNLVKGE